MGANQKILFGGLILLVGLGITFGTAATASPGGSITIAYGAIIVGLVQLVTGLLQMGGEDEPQLAGGGAQMRPLPAVPARLIAGSITADDYPASAIRAEAEGKVTVGFTIDAAGCVQDAHVLQSSGNSALDATTCRIIANRFRFEAARDAEGRSVPQEKTQSVHWKLPDE